jgi:hypothetical protein
MRRTLFGRIDAEWREFVARPSTGKRYDDWRQSDVCLASYVDLTHLVEFAQTPGHPAASDDALRCLARRSQTDAVAARALLQCVLYALPRLATRFRPAAGGDLDEIASVVVGAAYERIRTYPIERRPRHIAANIVLDTRQMVSRTLCRPRVAEVMTYHSALARVPDPPASASAQLIELVGEAVRSGRLDPVDARLIVLTRVFDVSVAELAAEHHCLPHSLRRRRLRAEAALVSAVA